MINNTASQPVRRWPWSVTLLFMITSGILTLGISLPADALIFAEDSQHEAAIQQVQPSAVSMASIMKKSWQDFLQAYNNHNLQEIDNTLNNLQEGRRNSGFPNATSYSLALLALAQQAHEQHDNNSAMILVANASNLSPDYSFPYQAESQLYFARKQWFSSLNSYFSGIKILFSNHLERLQLFAGICFVLAFLPLWLFAIIHIVLSLKYFRTLWENWGLQMGNKAAAIILFTVLFSGNTLIRHSFMLLPGLMLLFICFFPYYSCREKACSFILVLLLAVSPFAYASEMKIIDSIGTPFFQSVMAINFDSYQKKDQQNIIQPPPSVAGRKLQLFSQAVVAGKEKKTAAAISFLTELSRQDPHPPAAIYNNLGNYYYMDDQIKAAISAYKKAIAVDPSSGIYHYNLSLTYIKDSFALAQSEASFIQAWRLSPEIVNRQLANGQNINAPVLVHEPLPWLYTYHFVVNHSLPPGLKNNFFRKYFSPWGGTTFYLIFFSVIVFIMSFLWIKMNSSAQFCPLCGVRFHGVGRISEACPSCLHISRQSVNDSFAIRQEKKIRSFSRLMDGFFFLTGFVVPGTYQLALGQTVRGVLMLCGSFAIATSTIMLHKGMINIALFPPGSAWGSLVFPLLLLIVFYLANYYSWRQRKQQRLILRITA